ncbi:GNAT family N-acetyltransferase [Actinoplanes sp. NPDC026670]|uniref:GNAT family N-acetyltransferase n=1 Tax=Actinoplanes sp. NPDC026670 TaxID=3154700 RepID=UPI0033F7CCCF
MLDAYTRLYIDTFTRPPWNETWHPDDARQRLHDILTTPRTHHTHTALPDGTLTGFAIGHLERYAGGTDHFLLQEMCVHPDHQRQGLGTRLLTDLATQTPTATHWYLLTGRDTPAATFYQANGFRPAHLRTVYVRP